MQAASDKGIQRAQILVVDMAISNCLDPEKPVPGFFCGAPPRPPRYLSYLLWASGLAGFGSVDWRAIICQPRGVFTQTLSTTRCWCRTGAPLGCFS